MNLRDLSTDIFVSQAQVDAGGVYIPVAQLFLQSIQTAATVSSGFCRASRSSSVRVAIGSTSMFSVVVESRGKGSC